MPNGAKKVFATALSVVSLSDKEGIGSLRWEGNKCYKYVKLQNTTATVAGAAGDAVAYDAEDGGHNHHVVTDITDANAKPVGAGILAAACAGVAGTAYYCWIQIKGPCTLNTAIAASVDTIPVAAADGDPLVFGAADLTLRRANTVVDADAEARPVVAIAQDASAKLVSLDFPF